MRVTFAIECAACGRSHDILTLKEVAHEWYCRECVPDEVDISAEYEPEDDNLRYCRVCNDPEEDRIHGIPEPGCRAPEDHHDFEPGGPPWWLTKAYRDWEEDVRADILSEMEVDS